MIELAPGWTMHVDRGPDWLFVRVVGSSEGGSPSLPLAERVWDMMDQHFISRVVIEMDEVPVMHSQLIGELVRLQKRVHTRGGLLRLSGVNDAAIEAMKITRLGQLLPCFLDRGDAVMGRRQAASSP